MILRSLLHTPRPVSQSMHILLGGKVKEISRLAAAGTFSKGVATISRSEVDLGEVDLYMKRGRVREGF